MRLLVIGLLLTVATAPLARPASAVLVDITYTITGGSNSTTTIGGGAAPTGGTATVRWTLTSLNGAFSYGFGGTQPRGSLRTGSVTAPFVTALPNANEMTPSVYTPSTGGLARIIQTGSLPGPFNTAYVTHDYFPTAGQFRGSFRIPGSGGGTLIVTGHEVGRALVPEPNTAALLALGFGGLAAGRTAWRRKTRRNAQPRRCSRSG